MVGFFTFHAYKSWMPDREEGYVRRGEGVLPMDVEMADQYGRNSKEDGAFFDTAVQRIIIDALIVAASFQQFRLHAVGTDNTHIHVLASWTAAKDLLKLGEGMKSSITRALNKANGKRTWLSDGASREQVMTRDHFDHLMTTYVPKHAGLKWREGTGFYE